MNIQISDLCFTEFLHCSQQMIGSESDVLWDRIVVVVANNSGDLAGNLKLFLSVREG